MHIHTLDLYTFHTKQWQDMVIFTSIFKFWHILQSGPVSTRRLSPVAAAELTQNQIASKRHHHLILQHSSMEEEEGKEKEINCPFKNPSI